MEYNAHIKNEFCGQEKYHTNENNDKEKEDHLFSGKIPILTATEPKIISQRTSTVFLLCFTLI